MPKVILITGASAGLGEQVATYLAGKGHIVYGGSRSARQENRAFAQLVMDVCDEQSVRAAVKTITDKEGRIDVLINNAGLGIAAPVEFADAADVKAVFDTNLFGVIRTCQAVLPGMRKNKSGLIINISSIGSETGLPYRGIYSASKAALDRLTEALRLEVAPFGVQACYLQPGGINTDINRNRITRPLADGNPYKQSFERSHGLINESVSSGLDPATFGPVIERIIHTGNVNRNYRIGKPLEKLSVFLKSILPGRMYDKLISDHYKI
jgi:NAD(P)-dependent dehydrogenase (short-subunit alcohol dehydrogenase family)